MSPRHVERHREKTQATDILQQYHGFKVHSAFAPLAVSGELGALLAAGTGGSPLPQGALLAAWLAAATASVAPLALAARLDTLLGAAQR